MSVSAPNLQQLASSLPAEVQNTLRSALSAQDKFNRDTAQTLTDLESWTWQTPTFTNSWVDANGTRYKRDGAGNVYLEIAMKSGTTDVPAFNLLTPYRPSQSIIVPAYAIDGAFNQLARRFTIGSNGDVTPFGLSGGTLLFAAVVNFPASQGAG